MKLLTSFLLVFAVVVLVVWLRRTGVNPTKSDETSAKIAQPAVPSALPPPNPMQALMQTPIEFYGIVLDQEGKPVPAANVNASVLDNMIKGSPLSTTTDAGGKFTIQSQGMSLHIEVAKRGYYYVDRGSNLKPSSQGFYFTEGIGPTIHYSDSSAPAVFHLRKAGNPVPLERLVAQPKLPRDGTPVSVRLSKESDVALRIRCHTVEGNGPPTARYDWKCEVDVEGGGIQEAVDEYEFTAPEVGYVASAVIDMPKSLDVKIWSSRAIKNYWLRFPDNTFAKIRFRMIAGGDHFAVIEGFRNSTPSTRNLEPKERER